MLPTENSHHFDIHASVVFQLGESLISDVTQALVELIKNVNRQRKRDTIGIIVNGNLGLAPALPKK